jgi:hypothetical protein
MGLQGLDGSDAQVLELVVDLLTSPGAPAFVPSMLQALHDVGTAEGAHALHDAALELGIDRAAWPNGAEDLAVAVWVRSSVDGQYERLLTIAEVTVHERATEDRFREYFGQSGTPAPSTARTVEVLRDDLSDWFRSEGMGAVVTVKVHVEEHRTAYCVFHGGRFQRETAVDDDGRETMLGFRPLACDVIVHEPNGGALRVTARSRRASEKYRAAFGRALFSDAEFFTARPLYTLNPLAQAIGNGSLPPPAFGLGIQSVNLVACQWVIGDGVQVRVQGLRSRECIREAQGSGFHVDRVDLTEAKLAFVFAEAGRPRRIDVIVRNGNRLQCSRVTYRGAIEQYLESIGVRDAHLATRASGGVVPRWTGIQSVLAWRQLLGEGLQSAVDVGVLVQRERPVLADEHVPADVGTVPVIEHPGVGLIVVRGNESTSVVQPSALVGYELNGAQLGELVRRELRCERSLCSLAIDGAYDLGPLVIGPGRVRAFLLTKPSPEPVAVAVARVLGDIAAPDRWLSIHLPGTDTGKWTSALALPKLTQPYGLRRAIIHLLKLESQVSALELANGERLVVDTVNHLSWLDGTALDLAEGERLTLELLAAAYSRGQAVPATALGGAAGSPEAGRQRVLALNRAVRRIGGQDAPKVTTNVRKGEGYRLALPTHVVVGAGT